MSQNPAQKVVPKQPRTKRSRIEPATSAEVNPREPQLTLEDVISKIFIPTCCLESMNVLKQDKLVSALKHSHPKRFVMPPKMDTSKPPNFDSLLDFTPLPVESLIEYVDTPFSFPPPGSELDSLASPAVDQSLAAGVIQNQPQSSDSRGIKNNEQDTVYSARSSIEDIMNSPEDVKWGFAMAFNGEMFAFRLEESL